MNNIRLVVFGLFLFSACGGNPNEADILKKGENLFSKYGCAVCHSLNGTEIYGPPLNEIYLKKVKVIRNGMETTILADRDYLIKAIIDPRYEKVSDYQNKDMPIPLFQSKEAEILADYIIEINKKNNKK